MKLLKLKIHNIASVGDAAIDFEHGPLSREPLFLICGETGAGKSTILNCICMALFGKVPTMPSSNASGDDGLTVGDIRNYLRNGTGRGCATLDFENDGVRYEASTSLYRAHDKADGRFQPAARTLSRLDDGRILSRNNTEADRLVQEILRMDYEQFCRMFLLAQGQFSQFLKANDNEKSAILAELAGMGIYGKVGKYISDRSRDEQDRYKGLSLQIKSIDLFTEEEKAGKQAEIKVLDAKDELMKKEKNAVDLKIQWRERHSDISAKIKKATEKCESLKRELANDENLAKKETVKLWEETGELRKSRADFKRESEDYSKTVLAVSAERNTFFGYLADLKRAERHLLEMEGRLKADDYEFRQMKASESVYENSQTILSGLRQIAGIEADVKKNEEEIERLGKRIASLSEKSVTAQADFKKSETDTAGLDAEKKAKQKEFDDAGRTALQDRRRIFSEEVTSLERGKGRWQNLFNAASALRKAELDIELKKKKKADLDACLRDASLKCEESGRNLAEKDKLYEQQKLTVDECAKELRKNLVEGKPCPICGSTHHEVRTEETFESVYKKALEERDKARTEDENARKERTRLETETAGNDSDLERAEGKIQGLTRDMNSCASAWTSFASAAAFPQEISESMLTELSADGLVPIFDRGTEILKTATEEREKKISDYDEKIKAADGLEKELEGLRKDYDDAAQRLSEKKDALGKITADISADGQAVSNCKGNAENDNNKADELKRSIDGLMTDPGWYAAWKRGPEEFVSSLTERAAAYSTLKQRIPLERDELRGVKENLDSSRKSADDVIALMPSWNESSDAEAAAFPDSGTASAYRIDLSVALASFLAKAKGLIDNRDSQKKTMDLASEAFNNAFLKYAEAHPEAASAEAVVTRLDSLSENVVKQMNLEIDGLNNKKTGIEGSIKQLNSDMATIEADGNRPSDEETPEILKDKSLALANAIRDGQQELGRIRQILQSDTENGGRVKEKKEACDKQRTIAEKWETLDKVFGNDRFGRIAQQMTFQFLLDKANEHLRNLYPRYSLKCAKDSFVIMVNDADMCTSRVCDTLSGGETFIVSLALALGLSSLADTGVKVNTLLIDEGFGSLSPDCLDVVMDVLERLHGGGRQVGLISHVESLRERIPTQIRVARTKDQIGRASCRERV